MKRIVVGMSGGVDSSMSLLILKQQGWQPIGVTLKLPVWENSCNLLRQNVCCTPESVALAKSVCERLGAEHHEMDAQAGFRRDVMDYFLREHRSTRTPNPCVVCNPRIKFRMLFEWAHSHGVEHVATGHYARTRLNPLTGRYELLMACDRSKDQTYGLSMLPQEWLKNIVFPLGELTKKEVFSLAKREGFEVFLKRKESQDLCFVSGKSLRAFLEAEIGTRKGEIIDTAGKTLGTHRGLHFTTIGQHKGLGIPGSYRVVGFDTGNNRLIVSDDEKDLLRKDVLLEGVRYLSGGTPGGPLPVEAKVRYRQPLAAATLYPGEGATARVMFSEPQSAVTPGQFCVFYSGEVCLGAGAITAQDRRGM